MFKFLCWPHFSRSHGAKFNNQVDNVAEIPEERRPMAALEILSEVETVYYKRNQRFQAENGLDFNKPPETYFLRSLLEEPIGQYYLVQFSKDEKYGKNFEYVASCVEVWKLITALYKKELSIDDAIELKNREKNSEKIDETQYNPNSNDNSNSSDSFFDRSNVDGNHTRFKFTLTVNKAVKNEDFHRLAEKTIKLAIGFVRKTPTDTDIIATSKKVYELVTAELLSEKLRTLVPEVFKEFVDLVESIMSENKTEVDVQKLKESLGTIKICVFKVMEKEGVVGTFRTKRHFARYRNKYGQVYNYISHQDFDFMQTLGKGSFGRVIRVRKKTTQKQYALKVMSKKKILQGAENKEQVTIEKQVLLLCEFCPYIVDLHFGFQTTKALFIALGLLEGGTLTDAMYRPPNLKNKQKNTQLLTSGETARDKTQTFGETDLVTQTSKVPSRNKSLFNTISPNSPPRPAAHHGERLKKQKLSPNEVRVMAAQMIIGINHLHMHGIL
eukprot:snap_masked-scaffold_20-processed-gene-1.24-mRNA-1 protein AED:1.00 eAED:1.00 QI:0/0/0/0/1/1/4/0/497